MTGLQKQTLRFVLSVTCRKPKRCGCLLRRRTSSVQQAFASGRRFRNLARGWAFRLPSAPRIKMKPLRFTSLKDGAGASS